MARKDILQNFLDKKTTRGHGDKPYGSNGGNLFYNGDVLYSYGHHYHEGDAFK